MYLPLSEGIDGLSEKRSRRSNRGVYGLSHAVDRRARPGDPKLPFEVHVDASDTGIAGKLNQIEPSSDVQDESNVIPTPKERLIAPAGMCPELIFPYIPYLSAYPSGSSPALSRRRKNTGVNLK